MPGGPRCAARGPWSRGDLQVDVAVGDLHVVDGGGLGGGQARGLAGDEREGAAVLPALEGLLRGIDLALGEADVLVGAPVADGVDVVVDAHEGDRHAVDLDATGAVRFELVEPADADAHW